MASDTKVVPSGFDILDDLFGGGIPSGSLVLLSGEVGAGANEFAYTSCAMLSMAVNDPETFSLFYGSDPSRMESVFIPEETYYVSLNRSETDVMNDMRSVLDEERFEILSDHMGFVDLSGEYFKNTPVPRSWVEDVPTSIEQLGRRTDAEGLLAALADVLDEKGPGNAVILDSITSLVRVSKRTMDWGDMTLLLTGIQKVAKRWDGVIYGLLDRESLQATRYQELAGIADGVFHFDWEEEESWKPQMSLFINSMRGLRGKMSEENYKFETEISEEGFEVRSTMKVQ